MSIVFAHAFEHFPRGIVTGKSRDAAARMRAGAADIETFDRRPISCPARNRTHEQQLIESHIGVVVMAFGKAEDFRQIEWGKHLRMKDCAFEVGSVRGYSIDHDLPQLLALLFPISVF